MTKKYQANAEDQNDQIELNTENTMDIVGPQRGQKDGHGVHHRSHMQYSTFLSKQLNAPASFVLNTTEIANASNSELTSLPTPYAQNFKLIAQISEHVLEMGAGLTVEDTYSHPLLDSAKPATNSTVAAYIGVPICDDAGSVVAVICVVDTKIRQWSYTELTLLSEIAREIEAAWAT